MKLYEEVAKIIDPSGWVMTPSAYGLKTEEEMLRKTMVGPVRAVALEKARRIVALLNQQLTNGEKK